MGEYVTLGRHSPAEDGRDEVEPCVGVWVARRAGRTPGTASEGHEVVRVESLNRRYWEVVADTDFERCVPLTAGGQAVAARYLLVVRPADEESSAVTGPVAGFGLVGRSEAMGQVLRLLEVLQHSEATVLIAGENGTGKEVIARVIHAQSVRRGGSFVAVNAAAPPGELLESELFGHVRGAFTGATRDRTGRFEAVAAGTLFLDEVGDLPLHLQVKLLRVLQEHTCERVGDDEPRRANARIIAATHRNLRQAVGTGLFREDLHYRLRVFPIELPPSRARREHVEPFSRLLLSSVCARTGPRTCHRRCWPAPGACSKGYGPPRSAPPRLCPARTRMARAKLRQTLDEHRWNRAETAAALGLSRSTLWRRMRALGLARETSDAGSAQRPPTFAAPGAGQVRMPRTR